MPKVNTKRLEEIRALCAVGGGATQVDVEVARELLAAVDVAMDAPGARVLRSIEERERMARIDATARALFVAHVGDIAVSATASESYRDARVLEEARERFLKKDKRS